MSKRPTDTVIGDYRGVLDAAIDDLIGQRNRADSWERAAIVERDRANALQAKLDALTLDAVTRDRDVYELHKALGRARETVAALEADQGEIVAGARRAAFTEAAIAVESEARSYWVLDDVDHPAAPHIAATLETLAVQARSWADAVEVPV